MNEIDKTLKADFTVEKREDNFGKVDRYTIIKRLGNGGFGAVFLARDTLADILVALKVLPPEIAAVPEELENVRANFALVSRLHHHNIAGLLHLHQVENVDKIASQLLKATKGSYLVVMEYIEGLTLYEWRKQFPNQKVPFDQAIDVISQVAEALDYAHKQKIIHRDVKPANIMVQPDNTVKVLDFGLAYEIHSSMSRVTMEKGKTSAGTPNYMSPEQWVGNRLTESCDQYALACMFYEFISGSVPFASAFSTNDYRIIMNVIGNRQCEPLKELTSAQNAAIKKAMNKDPQKRFDSCLAFVNALQGMPSRYLQKRLLWSTVFLAVTILLVIAAGMMFSTEKKKKPLKSLPIPPEMKQQTQAEGAAPDLTEEETIHHPEVKMHLPSPGYNWKVPDSGGINMVWIKPGTVRLIRQDKNTVYSGNPNGFWLSQTEVTIGQFIQFLKETRRLKAVLWKNPNCPLKMEVNTPVLSGNAFGKKLNQPMTCVTSNGVIQFCIWLNRRERRLGRLPAKHLYHVPGLDLFKYAFLAGGRTKVITIDKVNRMISDKYCWSQNNSYGAPHAVATSQPSPLGLYDLVGNVYELAVDVTSSASKRNVKFAVFGASWKSGVPNYDQLISDYSAQKAGNEVGFRVALGLMVIRPSF